MIPMPPEGTSFSHRCMVLLKMAIVRCLLEVGADKDKEESRGATPLHVSSERGHLEVVRCLLEVGADKDKADIQGSTPLHVSSERGHLLVGGGC